MQNKKKRVFFFITVLLFVVIVPCYAYWTIEMKADVEAVFGYPASIEVTGMEVEARSSPVVGGLEVESASAIKQNEEAAEPSSNTEDVLAESDASGPSESTSADENATSEPSAEGSEAE